jgi:hypothetical protein
MTCGLLWVNNLEKPAGCVFKIESGDARFFTNLVNINLTTLNKVLENNKIYLHRFWNSASKNVYARAKLLHMTGIYFRLCFHVLRASSVELA